MMGEESVLKSVMGGRGSGQQSVGWGSVWGGEIKNNYFSDKECRSEIEDIFVKV